MIHRREPFTSAPNRSARTISAMLTIKTISAARLTWRGDGRAGGQRHHKADHHQRAERAEQPSVDRAKPIGDGAAFSARNHEPLLDIEAWAEAGARAAIHCATSARNLSPRSSKLAN